MQIHLNCSVRKSFHQYRPLTDPRFGGCCGAYLTVWIALFEFLSKHITSIYVFAYPLSNKKKNTGNDCSSLAVTCAFVFFSCTKTKSSRMKTTNFKTSKKISAPINGTDCVMLKYLWMRVYLVVVSLTIVATPCVSRQRHGASKSGADNFGHQYRTCDQVPPMWTDFVVPYQERFEHYV